MNKVISFISVSSILFGVSIGSSWAAAGGCKDNLNKVGYVTTIYVGMDSDSENGITFDFAENIADQGQTISSYRYLDAPAGRAIYKMLLLAYTAQLRIQIAKCSGDAMQGIALLNK